MITGTHTIIYTNEPEALKAWFRDVLEFPFVDVGDGWLIFSLPPSEVAVHPTEGSSKHELYLMCDDINATVSKLKTKGVEFTQPVSDQGWGLLTSIKLPDGGELGLYEPRHERPPHPERAAAATR